MLRAEIGSHIVLRDISDIEENQIEKELTFSNSKYEKIMKYSKWGSTREPKFLEFFKLFEEDGELCAEVPIGYNGIEISPDEVTDKRKLPEVDYPDFLMELRETQSEALSAYLEANSNTQTQSFLRGSIKLPTGKGKTVLGLALSHRLKTRTLVLVHKTDLVKGWRNDIEKAFGGKVDVGLIQAKSRKVGKHFTIATIQTLNNLSPKDLKSLYNYFGLVIQDEMHHCPSSSFELGNNFNCRYRLGLTATPERSDGLSCVMNLYYGDFCYSYGHQEKDEDILQVKVIKRPLKTYFNPVVTEVGKSSYKVKRKLDDPINFVRDNSHLKDKEKRITSLAYGEKPDIAHLAIEFQACTQYDTSRVVISDMLKEYNSGYSCVAFFSRKEEITHYKDLLVLNGVDENDIGLYYGDNKDCDLIIDIAESRRKYITLATYSKANEGTNVKQWEVGFLVSSINNGKNVEQAVGRIRRKSDGDKLSVARLYDYRYDNVYQLCRQGETRDRRYKQLKLIVSDKVIGSGRLFARGFNK